MEELETKYKKDDTHGETNQAWFLFGFIEFRKGELEMCPTLMKCVTLDGSFGSSDTRAMGRFFLYGSFQRYVFHQAGHIPKGDGWLGGIYVENWWVVLSDGAIPLALRYRIPSHVSPFFAQLIPTVEAGD